MKKLVAILFGALLATNMAFAGNYTLDNQAIDKMFDQATAITVSGVTSVLQNDFASAPMASLNAGTDQTTTILIAWIVDWFVGGFGIHRYVLGTKSNMWAIYTFTVCGIFGIVPLVDWFVLLIDGLIQGNGSKYMNNDKFFMWAN